MKFDATVDQQIGAPLDDMLFQFEIRNAVNQQPADAIIAVIDMYLLALLAQHFCRCQAAWPGTNDAHRLGPLKRRAGRFNPTLGERRIGDIALDGTDGD